ncbi:MAG: response regulator, partial [Candidatus Brocadiales bacterium]
MSAQKSPEHHIDTELLKNISVLCVEDEDDTREQLSQFLMSRVGTLRMASNGQEGLEAFKLHKP